MAGLERIAQAARTATSATAVPVAPKASLTGKFPSIAIQVAVVAPPPAAVGGTHDVRLHRAIRPLPAEPFSPNRPHGKAAQGYRVAAPEEGRTGVSARPPLVRNGKPSMAMEGKGDQALLR
jgi:hypothetical protein